MAWSYNTGERGKSWVRAFDKGGKLYLEWMEPYDPPRFSAEGRELRRRARQKLEHADSRRAENDARKLSDWLASEHDGGRPTAHRLIDDYIREVTPTKGESKQDHDERAARLFKEVLPATRLAEALDRSDWDAYVTRRRAGLCELGPVGDRQIQYDLKFLISVLGWGVGTRRLTSHPWGPEVRRTQGWRMPRNRTPRRPPMTDEIRALLSEHARNWRLPLALELARETISRNVSVRRLQWQDIDLVAGTVEWQKEKDGGRYQTPLTPRAVELLRAAPSRGIGAAWVFPSVRDAKLPCSRHAFQQWLKRAKVRLLRSIEDSEERERMRRQLRGLGFHGEKRAAVRDPRFRQLPATVRSALARTTAKTLDDVYDEVGLDDLREAQRLII